MELIKGYKQTEVGVIPSDWSLNSLGELGEVKMCRRIFNHETKPTGDIPFFKIGTFGKQPDAFITEDLYLDYKKRFSFPIKGEILISAAGTIGRTVVYDGGASYFQDSNIIWINNNQSLVSNSYLLHILKVVKYTTEGGTIQRLYNSILKNTQFVCPPLIEQTVIANALSDADAYINSLEKLIEKKHQIKQGVMQELLKPKDGWETKVLGDIGKTFGGLSGKTKDDFIEGAYPYIPFMNIMSNPIIDNEYFDYVNIKSGENQNLALKGDLFFNGSSETPEEVGMCSVLLDDIPNLYLNSFCFGFRIKNDFQMSGLYLSYYFRSKEGRKLFFSMAQGATRYNLSKSNFNKLKLSIPPIKEQNEIAELLFDFDSDIKIHEVKLEKAKSIKQGIMQNLLTGKIRLI
jgi:type I restriction enzyme S subunit